MSEHLKSKRALITGGSKGIGLAIARMLVGEGAQIAVCARKNDELQAALGQLNQAAQGGRVAGSVADVSNPAEVRRLFELVDKELGGLDILINNAGLGIFKPAAELTVKEWDQMIGTNLSGAFYCSREALHRFHAAGGGWIINISSLAGKNPFSGGAGYNASKFGLNGFSEALLLDHRNDDVRVSYIMPGSVDTEFSSSKETRKSAWKIAPEDIAEIVRNILHMPSRTLISRIEVRPSRPQKN